MDADEVIQHLFDDDFGLSENETSDEEGEIYIGREKERMHKNTLNRNLL